MKRSVSGAESSGPIHTATEAVPASGRRHVAPGRAVRDHQQATTVPLASPWTSTGRRSTSSFTRVVTVSGLSAHHRIFRERSFIIVAAATAT